MFISSLQSVWVAMVVPEMTAFDLESRAHTASHISRDAFRRRATVL